jgi:hypothetical protein
VQPLLDKIGGRIPGWKGKLLSMAGGDTLVKCVLSSQPIYHLTVFPIQKIVIETDRQDAKKLPLERRGTR